MSRVLLRHVQSFTKPSGVTYHYFRRKGSPLIALPGLPGSHEFNQAYADALAAMPAPIGKSLRSLPGSVSAAIAAYYGSQAFRNDLGESTQAARRPKLEKFREEFGHRVLGDLPRDFIVKHLNKMASQGVAKTWLVIFRHFIQWCLDSNLILIDPTAGIRRQRAKSDGHHCWTEEELAQYEHKHPIGSEARLAFAIGIFTGLRRSDIAGFGQQNIKNGMLKVKTIKTGVTVTFPVHQKFAPIIAATPSGHLTLLMKKTGKPYKPNDLSIQFAKWRDEAGLPRNCTLHGLRKAACRRMAEAGCTAQQIMAVTGHKTLKEVERYIQAFDRTRLASEAILRIA